MINCCKLGIISLICPSRITIRRANEMKLSSVIIHKYPQVRNIYMYNTVLITHPFENIRKNDK